MLPAHTTPGPRDVQAQGSHYEIKLMNNRPSSSSSPSSAHTSDNEDDGPPPLLDASQLTNIKPSSFLCASCSLPLIQSSRVSQYRDLPSEHWEELVEAWMCHGDQKLSEQVAKQGQSGFWPAPGQGLVGGSYILFEESAMNNNNLHITKEARVRIFVLLYFHPFPSFFFCRSVHWASKKTGVGTPYQRPDVNDDPDHRCDGSF